MTLVHLARCLSLGGLALACPLMAQGVELVVATVNNGHMITLQRLSASFEQSHPNIHVKWIISKKANSGSSLPATSRPKPVTLTS